MSAAPLTAGGHTFISTTPSPFRSVTLVTTGTIPNSLTALLAGGVSASLLAVPASFEAEDAGMRLLDDTAGERRYATIAAGVVASSSRSSASPSSSRSCA